uniref:Uncharacterized protein n=1 Tax=Arundo donax TaxID=35708 RepID=A0A0A9EXL2_ARUDO
MRSHATGDGGGDGKQRRWWYKCSPPDACARN